MLEKKDDRDAIRGFGIKYRAWISRIRAYQISRTIGENYGVQDVSNLNIQHIWDHFWRSQWASYLKASYDLTTDQLNNCFICVKSGRPLQ